MIYMNKNLFNIDFEIWYTKALTFTLLNRSHYYWDECDGCMLLDVCAWYTWVTFIDEAICVNILIRIQSNR